MVFALFLSLIACAPTTSSDAEADSDTDSDTDSDSDTDGGRGEIIVTTVGSPDWEVVEMALFVGELGTAAQGFMPFYDTIEAVLPHHQWDDVANFASTGAHGGFDTELSAGLAAAGYDATGPITAADLIAPSGWFFVFVVTPTDAAPVGDTPDAQDVPLLEGREDIPLYFDGDLSRDGTLVDPYFDGAVYTLATPDGASHVVSALADNDEAAGTDLGAGAYTFTLSLRDPGERGYDIAVPFEVR